MKSCLWCGKQSQTRYCSRECFRKSRARAERERVRFLKEHGLCPRCRAPLADCQSVDLPKGDD